MNLNSANIEIGVYADEDFRRDFAAAMLKGGQLCKPPAQADVSGASAAPVPVVSFITRELWCPVSLLRKAGEPKAPVAVRRLVWTDGVPASEYLHDNGGGLSLFADLPEARRAIAGLSA